MSTNVLMFCVNQDPGKTKQLQLPHRVSNVPPSLENFSFALPEKVSYINYSRPIKCMKLLPLLVHPHNFLSQRTITISYIRARFLAFGNKI